MVAVLFASCAEMMAGPVGSCPNCSGTGRVIGKRIDASGLGEGEKNCPECMGTSRKGYADARVLIGTL